MYHCRGKGIEKGQTMLPFVEKTPVNRIWGVGILCNLPCREDIPEGAARHWNADVPRYFFSVEFSNLGATWFADTNVDFFYFTAKEKWKKSMYFLESFSDKGKIGLSSSCLCTKEDGLRNISYFFCTFVWSSQKKVVSLQPQIKN